MASFEVEVLINGPQEKVFDVVTTTGLWPQWADLARAVAGVTERPFQLGDPIYEFCRTPTGPQEIMWHITEHDRPHHAKLEAEDGTTITYTFIGKGDNTIYRREFELGSVLAAQQPLPYTIENSRAENAKVKALVENILWREQKGRNLP
jgi:polyketide cyclase/dehydrase/lipid transport protein